MGMNELEVGSLGTVQERQKAKTKKEMHMQRQCIREFLKRCT
jgi:hypothetical protein